MLHINRLINERSPYLLQHAHNPVDWYPWGAEALDRAKDEDKPILVSIGYAACHWCHVMERESFVQPEVAAIMNKHFINIKIDREERPDLDHIYMDALQAMSGSGGWPLNMFLTPDLKPFYGGTYFPKVRIYNKASWLETLNAVRQAFIEHRADILTQADNMTAHLIQANSFGQQAVLPLIPVEELITKQQLSELFNTLMQQADQVKGGFGRAPKFPQTFSIQWLLRYYHYTGLSLALQQACLSLDKILNGGIYDQLGGGLARYSTDADWLAPHFEKMLYDNALLVQVLCEAFQITKEGRYKKAIKHILSFVQRDWLTADGGFYAAYDADSEGLEGKYYTWSKKEILEVLKQSDAKLFCDFYGVTEEGNWENTNILHVAESPEVLAQRYFLPLDELYTKMEMCRVRLLMVRDNRAKPLLDDKQLLNWNALMNIAFSKAYGVTGEVEYKQIAEKNMEFMLLAFSDEDEGFNHVYKEGSSYNHGFLDDYANLIAALVALQEVTGTTNYLLKCRKLVNYVIDQFGEECGGFFYYTRLGQGDVIVRKKEIYDGATPSGNAIMAQNLWYLSIAFDEPDWKKRATKMIQSLKSEILRYPTSFGIWAQLLLQAYFGIYEIAIIGEKDVFLLKEVLKVYIPNRIIQASSGSDDNFPLLKGKKSTNDTLIYVCRNYTCKNPISTIVELRQQIEGHTQ